MIKPRINPPVGDRVYNITQPISGKIGDGDYFWVYHITQLKHVETLKITIPPFAKSRDAVVSLVQAMRHRQGRWQQDMAAVQRPRLQ